MGRAIVALLACGGVLAAGLAPAAAGEQEAAGRDPASAHERVSGLQSAVLAAKAVKGRKAKARPSGANPYLALLPEPGTADYAGWDSYLRAQGQRRAERLATQSVASLHVPPLVVDEDEPAGSRGSNDRATTAQPVPGFGTTSGANHRARLLGMLSSLAAEAEDVPANAEDDGAIPLAGDTGIPQDRDGIRTEAEIGDGPHGRAGTGSGDFDFYQLDARARDVITVDTDTPVGELDSMVAVFDSDGEMVAFNDDAGEGEDFLDSFVRYDVPVAGTYYVMVSGFPNVPEDPFDSSSGNGAGSEGPYAVEILLTPRENVDVDFYSVRLRRGDVLGGSVEGGAARLAVYDTPWALVQGSSQDVSFIYPDVTRLPGGGNAVVDHVADRTGTHFVAVSRGSGDYDVTLEVYRAPLDSQRPAQTLFLDFDGARVNTAIWGGAGVRQLSPLRSFLGRWGLTNADLDELVTRTVAEVQENIRRDLAASGVNRDFTVTIRNSRDHADTFGRANVSRVIVGGTIAQSGLPTIGIAESIDPGNFDTKESAVVLLDSLSEPAGEDYSLNTYLTGSSDKVGFVAQALGNLIAHEAGHFFGDWHVDPFNDQANLMDSGGNFPVLYGVGDDGIGGTADDPDVDFGEDVFDPNEGFDGTENTLSRVAFGLTR